MRIGNLTFGQLLKLHSPHTLVRVTGAYHDMLRRRWCRMFPGIVFSVSGAEEVFRPYAEPWLKLIGQINSRAVRVALRKSADETQVPHIPGMKSVITSIRLGITPAAKQDALARAKAIQVMCQEAGVPCWLNMECYPWGHELQLLAETNSLGINILLYRHGLSWTRLEQICGEFNTSAAMVFSWVPVRHRHSGGLVNPAVFPMDTPDWSDIAETLVNS